MTESLSGPEAQAVEVLFPGRAGPVNLGVMFKAITLRLDSQIEYLFLAGLIEADRCRALRMIFEAGEFDWAKRRDLAKDQFCQDPGVYVWAQAKVLGYVADFLVWDKRDAARQGWYVVECDGHAFHAADPDAVAWDRRRDRVMTAQGIRVFRFTGRELTADYVGCARSFVDILASRSAL